MVLFLSTTSRDQAPVYINYTSQFKDGGTTAAATRARKTPASKTTKPKGRRGAATAATGFMSAAVYGTQQGSEGRGSKGKRRRKKGKAGSGGASGGSSGGGRRRKQGGSGGGRWSTVGGQRVRDFAAVVAACARTEWIVSATAGRVEA